MFMLGGMAAVFLTFHAKRANGVEVFDSRTREMLRRASSGEKPTPEDQRLAARMLRDWELSERTAPINAPSHTRHLLQSIISGEEVRAPYLIHEARGLTARYMTPDGYAKRLRFGPYGPEGRAPGAFSGSEEGGPLETPDSTQHWFLFAACLLIMLGGIVIWVLGRRRNRPDYRAYYS